MDGSIEMTREGRASSTRSKSNSSTLAALLEKTEKLTPPGTSVAPIGKLQPAVGSGTGFFPGLSTALDIVARAKSRGLSGNAATGGGFVWARAFKRSLITHASTLACGSM